MNSKARNRNGVVCSFSLLKLNNGKVRIVVDDVVNSKATNDQTWEHENFFTFKDYDSASFENLELSESEFADFGHSILARLIHKSKYTDHS